MLDTSLKVNNLNRNSNKSLKSLKISIDLNLGSFKQTDLRKNVFMNIGTMNTQNRYKVLLKIRKQKFLIKKII